MKNALFAILIAAALLLSGCASKPLNEGADSNGRAYRGADNAKLTIYEYSDFECPYCGKVQPALDEVMRQYSDRVRLEFRHYPLPIHPRAEPSAIAAVCAERQGKFWAMYDKLFSNQQALEDADLQKYAKEIGLDEANFSSCVASGSAKAAVQADMQEAASIGVQATPTFIIGETIVKGAQSADKFRSAIDNELAKLR
ncbi:MAG: thioredoxin domain-containing protein [Candidatus Micrarchaeia archaeon]